jgi:ABC-type multidrug transport system fused ATPase/permease subunit
LLPTLKRSLLFTYARPEWPRAVLLGVLLCSGIALQLANPLIVKQFIDHAQASEPLVFGLIALYRRRAAQIATVAKTYVAEDLGGNDQRCAPT